MVGSDPSAASFFLRTKEFGDLPRTFDRLLNSARVLIRATKGCLRPVTSLW